MAKATRRGILARITGRRTAASGGGSGVPVVAAPVITADVPDESLPVGDRMSYLMLRRAINQADDHGVHGNTRAAALRGMERLASEAPEEMERLIRQAGACGTSTLVPVIRALAGYGRARAGA